VSLAIGRIFGAWVDLRRGEGFGRCFTSEMGPETAVFVPRGVGNAFQTLVDHTVYSYLVNDHWHPQRRSLTPSSTLPTKRWRSNGLFPSIRRKLSEPDKTHPRLVDVTPVGPQQTLIIGAGGQLGRALIKAIPAAVPITRATLDLASRTPCRDSTLGHTAS
jgi:hypothetical protein